MTAELPDASRSGRARVTFFGHATVGVELGSTLVLTDPILRSRVGFLRWRAPQPQPADWDNADAVLISHLHYDHCDLPSLRRLGRDRTLLVPHGSERLFERRGFSTVLGMQVGQSHQLGDVTVTATAAAHDGRRHPFGLRASALGYLLSVAGMRVYFAGDTDLFPGMRDIGGDLGVALLPVWGWGPSVGVGHLDPARAATAVTMLAPRVVVPIHWGALRPVWERHPPTDAPATEFAAEVERDGTATQVVIVAPGASATLPTPL